MLVVDNLVLSGVGAICSVIMARLWSATDVGTVASITGAMNILVVASVLGMPTTIVRFLGGEPHQRRLLRQALTVTGVAAGLASAALALIPGHLGVPLDSLELRPTILTVLFVVYGLVSVVASVGDPAYVARQEVSFLLGKDVVASMARIVLILLVSHSRSQSLFLASLGYSVVAGGVDLLILSRRLRGPGGGERPRPLQPLRAHLSFALGIHIALIASSTPAYLLPTITAALTSRANSAFVAMALQVGTVLTLVPAQTGQSLLSDLSQRPDLLVQSSVKALRGAYLATLPLALVVGVAAPWILLVFGTAYSHHGAAFLRWSACGSVFFVFNYIADVVLLARHKVREYIAVNIAGTIVIMALLVTSLETRFTLLGPAWLIGQAAYAAVSGLVLVRLIGARRGELRSALGKSFPGRVRH